MSIRERTKSEAQLDIRYARCWNAMNESLFGRIDWIFGAVTLFGGSAIAFTVTADNKHAVIALGAIVAVSAILERMVGAKEKQLEHRAAKKRFAELDGRSGTMTLEEIDRELRPLQADGPAGVQGLAIPAFNANLQTNGYEDGHMNASLWSRFLMLLA